jgi:pseudouridine kinase
MDGVAEDGLTGQERAVLAAIGANPFIGQQDIAQALGLARSTVAAHIASLVQKGRILGRGYVLAEGRRVLCLGAAVVDRKYRLHAAAVPGSSNPADGTRGFGGVARNVAENLVRLGAATGLVSVVGDDEDGHALIRDLRRLGVDAARVAVASDRPTAGYVAVLGPDGDLVMGIADMAIFGHLTPAALERAWPALAAANWVFADCNLPPETLADLLERRRGARFRLALDAVSVAKAARLPADLAGIDLLFCNRDEAAAVLGAASTATAPEQLVAGLQARGAAAAVVTLGAAGLCFGDAGAPRRLPAVPARPVDVTGAGDALIAATLHRLLNGRDLDAALAAGAALAALTIATEASVLPGLTADRLDDTCHTPALSDAGEDP